jgi:hypothetical protein
VARPSDSCFEGATPIRFRPTELFEDGPRVAVALAVTDLGWEGTAEVYTVFTFREPDDRAVLLEDCRGRADAVAKLRA